MKQQSSPDLGAARASPSQRITWTLRDGSYVAVPTGGSRDPAPRAPTMPEQVEAARDALQPYGVRDPSVVPSPGAAMWRWDLATGSVEWDAGLRILFGYGEGITDAAWRRNLMHPGDRHRVETSLQRATIRNDGCPWSERYRLRKADGSYTRVAERAYVLNDDAGPCNVVGAITPMPELGPRPRRHAPGARRPSASGAGTRTGRRSGGHSGPTSRRFP